MQWERKDARNQEQTAKGNKGIIVVKPVVQLEKQDNNCFRLTVQCNFFPLPGGA